MAVSSRNPSKLAAAQKGNLFEVFGEGNAAGCAAGTRTGEIGAKRTPGRPILPFFAHQLSSPPPCIASLSP